MRNLRLADFQGSWLLLLPLLESSPGVPLKKATKSARNDPFEKEICEESLLGQFPGILAQGAFFNAGNLARGSFRNKGIQLGILIRIKEH